jgi:hypothetical protein
MARLSTMDICHAQRSVALPDTRPPDPVPHVLEERLDLAPDGLIAHGYATGEVAKDREIM